MRGNKHKESTAVDTIDTLIGTGTVFRGDLEFKGGLRIDGHIQGHVTAQDTSKGTLVLSETALVEGDINVPHIVVNGEVKGNVISNGHIELQTKARVTGDVHYKAVEMQLGALLNGALVSDSNTPVYDVIAGGAEEKS